MKKTVMLLTTCLLMGLCACSFRAQTPVDLKAVEPVHFSAPVARQEPVQAETTAARLPEGASLLTEQELRWFSESYFNVLPEQGPNLFLRSSYQDPAQLDLATLFAAGAGDRTPLTERELRQLDAEDCARLGTEQLEELLLRYTGLGLAQMDDSALAGLHYLADFDAFYAAAGQADYVRFLYGYHHGDGLVTLCYPGGAVTLRQEAGRWLIAANALEDPAI